MAKKEQTEFEKALLHSLKNLGDEEIEFTDVETGDSGTVTRAEALARTVWHEALGYSVYAEEFDPDGKIRRVFREYHKPDRASKQLIFDHLLGKPKPQAQSKSNDRKPRSVPLHERINDSLVAHVNAMVENEDGDSGNRKTRPRNPISERMRRLGMRKDGSGSAEGPGEEPEASYEDDGESGQ